MLDKQSNVDISTRNTLSLPCVARELVRLPSLDVLQKYLVSTTLKPSELLILGGGSNLILPPFLDRVVVQYSGSACCYSESANGEVLLVADAGLQWDALVEDTVSRGLYGLENLSLIPGSVGAAPVQNIGAYGVELSSLLQWVQVLNFESGELEQLNSQQCQFAYRDSLFKRNPGTYLISKVCLKLSEQRRLTLNYGELRELEAQQGIGAADVRARVITLRRTKLPDPSTLANAGSFFKNPVISDQQAAGLRSRFPSMVSYPLGDGDCKLAAGWLIEQAGWKGFRRESVGVHTHQALVLVNYGGAMRDKLLALAGDIQDSVGAKFGISLEIEPVIVD